MPKKWFLLLVLFGSLILLTRYWIRNPSLSILISSITHFQTEDKIIALSFDDGPNPACTPQLLALLKKHQVKASFFLIGKQIEAHPQLAQQIFLEGHQLANHSYQHEKMIFKSQAYIEGDLLKTDSLLHDLGVQKLDIYRPPFGYSFINLPIVLKKHHKQLLTWSVNPSGQYELPQQPKKIIDQILDQIHKGAIIVLHDGGAFAQQDALLEVVDQIIPELKKQGYRFVSIDMALEL